MEDRARRVPLSAARVPQKRAPLVPAFGVTRGGTRRGGYRVLAALRPQGVGQRVAWLHRHAGVLVARRVLVVGGPSAIWS